MTRSPSAVRQPHRRHDRKVHYSRFHRRRDTQQETLSTVKTSVSCQAMTARPNYLEFVAKQLKLPARRNAGAPLAYDLFAGCGGLGLGLEAAGFHTVGFEMLPDACMTYRQNLRGPCNQVVLDTT